MPINQQKSANVAIGCSLDKAQNLMTKVCDKMQSILSVGEDVDKHPHSYTRF